MPNKVRVVDYLMELTGCRISRSLNQPIQDHFNLFSSSIWSESSAEDRLYDTEYVIEVTATGQ